MKVQFNQVFWAFWLLVQNEAFTQTHFFPPKADKVCQARRQPYTMGVLNPNCYSGEVTERGRQHTSMCDKLRQVLLI